MRPHFVEINIIACTMTKNQTSEIKLLSAFMRHPGKVLTRAFLMKAVWETDYLGDTRTLDVHISWLRKKLKKCASQQQYLKTVRGVGYWLGDA